MRPKKTLTFRDDEARSRKQIKMLGFTTSFALLLSLYLLLTRTACLSATEWLPTSVGGLGSVSSVDDAAARLGTTLGEFGSFQATRFEHDNLEPFFIVHPWAGASPDAHASLVEFTTGDTYAYIRAMLKKVLSSDKHPLRCIDIGTNIGYITHTMAAAGCEVWSFEANPRTVAYVRQSIALNGWTKRVHLTSGGVSSGTGGYLTFAHRTGISKDKAWSVSLFDKILSPGEQLEPGSTAIQVPLINPMQHLLTSSEPEGFAMLKIDCEGCEPMAVESLVPLLRRGDIRVLLFEWEFDRLEGVAGEGSGLKMLTTLVDFGYELRMWDMSPVQATSLVSDPNFKSLGDVWAFAPSFPTSTLDILSNEAKVVVQG